MAAVCNNSSSNSSILNCLANQQQPPLEIELWFRIIIGTLLISTFILGTTGNMYLIISTCTEQKNKRSIHLYTLNLAISDLLVLMIYLPMTSYQIYNAMEWDMGPLACRISYWTIASTINANLCTLIAVTRDRYIAVTSPIISRSHGLSSVKKALCCIWMISLLLSLPLFIIVDVENNICHERWTNFYLEQIYWVFMFTIQLVLPITYFTYAYSVIAYHLRIGKIPKDQNSYKIDENILLHSVGRKRKRSPPKKLGLNMMMSLKRKKQQDRLIKLAVLLIMAYIICVSPQHAVFFAHTYGNLRHTKHAIYIFIFSNFLMVFNSFINPMLFLSQGTNVKTLKKKKPFGFGGFCAKLHPGKIIFRRHGWRNKSNCKRTKSTDTMATTT